MRIFGMCAGRPSGSDEEYQVAGSNAPPIFFSVLPKRKRAAPGPKEKNAWRRTCTCVQVCLIRGSSESVLTKTGESSAGSRRTWAFALLCPRVCRSGGNFGVGVERPVFLNSLALCLVVSGGLETGGCGHPPLRGGGWGGRCCAVPLWGRTYVSARLPDSLRHSVGADALVGPRLSTGQRQRESWQNARAAPAERGRQGIQAHPGPKDSPRALRLMRPLRGTANHPPPAAWRYALCADRPAVAFFSFGPGAARLSPA